MAAESGDADPVEAYRAVRAHELMLNEASAAWERSLVAPVLTLNGGATVALLTLIGALGQDAALTIDLAAARAAVAAWMAGLLLAALAALFSARRQTEVNIAYRLMRDELEQHLFPAVAGIIRPVAGGRDRLTSSEAAQRYARRFRLSWASAVTAFVIGGVLAAVAVGSS